MERIASPAEQVPEVVYILRDLLGGSYELIRTADNVNRLFAVNTRMFLRPTLFDGVRLSIDSREIVLDGGE